MVLLTPEKLRKIIRVGLIKEGKITSDYLETKLNRWKLNEKDFSYIAHIINESIVEDKKNQRNSVAFVDDSTLMQILSIISLRTQLGEKLRISRNKTYSHLENQLVPEIAETVKIRNGLSLIIKK